MSYFLLEILHQRIYGLYAELALFTKCTKVILCLIVYGLFEISRAAQDMEHVSSIKQRTPPVWHPKSMLQFIQHMSHSHIGCLSTSEPGAKGLMIIRVPVIKLVPWFIDQSQASPPNAEAMSFTCGQHLLDLPTCWLSTVLSLGFLFLSFCHHPVVHLLFNLCTQCT